MALLLWVVVIVMVLLWMVVGICHLIMIMVV